MRKCSKIRAWRWEIVAALAVFVAIGIVAVLGQDRSAADSTAVRADSPSNGGVVTPPVAALGTEPDPKPGATLPAPAGPRGKAIAGSAVYRLLAEYRTSIRPAANSNAAGPAPITSVGIQIHTRAEGTLQVRATPGPESTAELTCRFSDLFARRTTVSPTGQRSEESEADLGLTRAAEIRVRVDAQGKVVGVGVPAGLAPAGADLLQAMLSQAAFLLPSEGAKRWETDESDLTGPYRATWVRSVEGSRVKIVKTKSYQARTAGPAHGAGPLVLQPGHEGQVTYWFDAGSGWLGTCRGQERVTLKGTQSELPVEIVQRAEFEMDRVSLAEGRVVAVEETPATEDPSTASVLPDAIAAGPRPSHGAGRTGTGSQRSEAANDDSDPGQAEGAATGGAARAGTGETSGFSPRTSDASIDAARLDAIVLANPFDQIAVLIEEARTPAELDRVAADSFQNLLANFARSDEAVADAVSRFERLEVRAAGVYLDALSASGNPNALAAVVGVARSEQYPEPMRARALNALSGARAPGEDVLLLLEESLAGSEPVSRAAAAALGFIGHRNVDAPRDRIAAALETRLDAPTARTSDLLEALGNNGAAGSLPRFLAAARDPAESVRRSAAYALRKYTVTESAAALTNALRTDASPQVREAAAHAARSHADAGTAQALSERIFADPDARVRSAALDSSIARMPRDAEARRAVENAALNAPDEDARERAQAALQREQR